MNSITTNDVLPIFLSSKCWYGVARGSMTFMQPDGGSKVFGKIRWFTNLSHKKREELLVLWADYDPQIYQKYDNYDAIETVPIGGRNSVIPKDYDGVMGVPISFLERHNPLQFEIVGSASQSKTNPLCTKVYSNKEIKEGGHNDRPVLKSNGTLRPLYARILIRRKR